MQWHDIRHTSRSTLPGPDHPVIEWSLRHTSFDDGTPVLAEDGTLYLVGTDSLFAINGDGTPKWSIENTANLVEFSPAILSNGAIAVGGLFQLRTVEPNGTQKWVVGISSQSSPMTTSDGTVYSADLPSLVLHSVDSAGNLNWTLNFDGPYGAPAIDTVRNTLYVSHWPALTALNLDGSFKWSYQTDRENSSPSVGSDGTVYFATNSSIFALNPNGSLRWEYSSDSTAFELSPPAISLTGSVYAQSLYPGTEIFAIDTSGGLEWKFDAGTQPTSDVVLDSRGVIYFGTNNNQIIALNADGSQRWITDYFDGDIRTDPIVGPGNKLYVVTAHPDHRLVSIRDGSTAVEEDDRTGGIATRLTVNQNFPNPFNPSTTFGFTLPKAAMVEVTVLNVVGQRVALLLSRTLPKGYHALQWDGRDGAGSRVPSGVYIYRVSTEESSVARKMILLK